MAKATRMVPRELKRIRGDVELLVEQRRVLLGACKAALRQGQRLERRGGGMPTPDLVPQLRAAIQLAERKG